MYKNLNEIDLKTTFSDHCKPNLHFFAEYKPYHTPTANIRTWWRSNKLHRQIWRTKMSYFSFSLIIPLYNHPSLFIVRHMLYTWPHCVHGHCESAEELFIYLLIYLYVTSLSTAVLRSRSRFEEPAPASKNRHRLHQRWKIKI